jgi:hypothetical protein
MASVRGGRDVVHRVFCWIALIGVGAGCGSNLSRPLEVRLGSPRDEVVAALRANDYCRSPGARGEIENYAPCEAAGLDLAESWVVARYDRDGKLDRVTRYERQPDDAAAAQRWEGLVTRARHRLGAESPEARRRLAELTEPPDGTVAWAAWFSGDATAIEALYPVRPGSERSPNVVEDILWAVAQDDGKSAP